MTYDIEICLEHKDFIIVNKPSGVAMHDVNEGIVALTKSQYANEALLPCHRLDTPTSGLLILAKSSEAAAEFGELFERRAIQKFYVALTDGKPKKKQGTIEGDMKNRRRGQHVLLKSKDNPAATQFFSNGLTPGIRATIVRPLTGKTHQIRVAMKSNGSPILGDTHYSGKSSDRLYLHAYQLSFCYQNEQFTVCRPPTSGQHFCTDAFAAWIEQVGAPELLKWPAYKKR